MERVLFVLTSHSQLGATGIKTGAHLAEITHPYEVLKSGGFEIDFVSPMGGRVPLDHFDLDDAINEKWITNDLFRARLEATMTPSQVVCQQYKAIFYVGGHGAMFDFPDNEQLAQCAAKIYEAGGVIGSVCHGAAGLLDISIDGRPLLDGREVSAFTNEEEVAIGMLEVMPFLLEDRIIEEGGMISKASPFQRHVVVSDRLVTGQNPASSTAVGEEIRKLISRSRFAFIDKEETTIAP